MAEKIFVTRAQLDAIAAGLSKLKKKEDERFPLKAGVARISAQITEALSKGHTYVDIAEFLRRDHNIEMKTSTLSSYHRAASGSAASGSKTSGSRANASSATGAAQPNRPAHPLNAPNAADSKFSKDPEL